MWLSKNSPEIAITSSLHLCLDALVAGGVELNRSYSYRFCSPTRSSLQSGRLPTHVNIKNLEPDVRNPADPVAGFAAIPRNMTGIATKMRAAGYATHQVGKWDCGMATRDHTPAGRGYSSSFGYFHHANDYWTEALQSCKPSSGGGKVTPVDLWDTDGPAYGMNGSAADLSLANYEETKFARRALDVIARHNVSGGPLFLNYDFHLVHEPLEVPAAYYERFDFMRDASPYIDKAHNVSTRQTYAAMVKVLDDIVGNLTAALKARGMWENTLVALQSE